MGSRALRQRTAGKSGARRQNAAGRVGGEPVRQRESATRYFKNHYGPTIEDYANVGDNLALAAELDAQLIELARQYLADGVMEWEYLLVTATKR